LVPEENVHILPEIKNFFWYIIILAKILGPFFDPFLVKHILKLPGHCLASEYRPSPSAGLETISKSQKNIPWDQIQASVDIK
jgi:hypothetical protein